MNKISRYKPKKVQNFVWSPKLAYAVGLLVTDGCLSSDGRHIVFVSKDIEQIKNIIKIFKLNNKIGLTKNKRCETHRVQIGNVQLYDWLLKIGLTPNKSLIIGEIKIPDKYFIDFLRGHLDGDGSINTYIDRYNTKKKPEYIYKRIFVSFISASEKHILWLRKKIIENIHVNGALHRSNVKLSTQNPMYIIKFAKKESLKILEKIYYSNLIPYLSRKKLKYTEFLKNNI